jgi:hypothetical protein
LWSALKEGASILPKNYVLRITREEWLRQVFSIKKYYPGVPRSWEEGGIFLLIRKAEKGDSFIGYGVLERFVKRDVLPKEKRQECEKMGWKGELVFSELYRFEPPVPIKETILGNTGVRGRCFHGYPLNSEQVESILNAAREKSAFFKID